MGALLDITGNRYGHLVAIRRVKCGETYKWQCKCDCGNTTKVLLYSLRSGVTISCRCYQRINNTERNFTHRLSKTTTYKIWGGMVHRATNPKRDKNYGPRGITICKRWLRFENFLDDMGMRPSEKHSIGRINNNKGYYKSNCRWETLMQQIYNRTVTVKVNYRGKKITIHEASLLSGVSKELLRDRRKRGVVGDRLFEPKNINRAVT